MRLVVHPPVRMWRATGGCPSPHMAKASWVIGAFDPAGEVLGSYAAGASAISRANGAMRILAHAVSRHHFLSRSRFSPAAVRMWPRWTRARPI